MTARPPRYKTPTDLLRARAKPAPQTGRSATVSAGISAGISAGPTLGDLRDRDTMAERGQQATLAEVFADRVTDAAPVGFVLAHLKTDRPILWVQDRVSIRESGRPCLAGMPAGLQVIHVTVTRASDLLWTLEEGLGCPALGGVLGEIWGDPAQLDFTATKRLALRSEAHGVPCWLIRRGASANLSAARERWRVGSLPALPDPDDMRAPGAPLWTADLFRSRWRQPGHWVAQVTATDGLVLEHGRDQSPHDALDTTFIATQGHP